MKSHIKEFAFISLLRKSKIERIMKFTKDSIFLEKATRTAYIAQTNRKVSMQVNEHKLAVITGKHFQLLQSAS